MCFFTDAVLSTVDKGIDVESMAVGDIEYCSITAMLRMGEEDKDDGVNPVVTEVTSKWGSEDQRKFTMTTNGKAFHLTINRNWVDPQQVRLERTL